MSDREGGSRSPLQLRGIMERDHHSPMSPGGRNHKGGRSYSRERDMEREREPRREGPRRDRSRSRSRSTRRYRSSRYSRSRSRSPQNGGFGHSSHSHSPMSSRRRHTGTRDHPKPSRCLGVFGLSVYTTEDELLHIMGKYGPVERVQVVIDAKTGRSRGFSFVYFETSEDAKVAKENCSGMKINGKSIRVDFSITERAHTPTPGIYMGKPTYKYSDRGDRRRGSDRDRDEYYRGSRSSHRRSPSPYYHRHREGPSGRRYQRSRSRSYSPRRY